jgi:CubicO group peptidase (beta-lactamase class C family)
MHCIQSSGVDWFRALKNTAMSLILTLTSSSAVVLPQAAVSNSIGAQIDDIARSHSAAGDFNGTVLVAREGRILYEGAFGLANREWGVPNDLQTKFEIGSMTKQFTALLVLQLVNEGKIDLDGYISDYLPYYRKDTGTRVTVRELLSHTSGVPNFLETPGFLDGPASRTRYSTEEFAEKYCSGDLHFEPGTKFEYSNSGYFLLGAILEQISKEPFERLLRERIFDPLGMKDSGYTHSEAILPHRAAGYERSPAGFRNARYYDMSIPFAAGALYSTVGDLFLWDQALYSERLLPASLRDLLFRPNLYNYGFGWGILIPKAGAPYAGENIPMHGGEIFGFQSLIERIPAQKELIVLLDNSDSPKLLDIALEIRGVLAKAHTQK